LRKYRGKSSAFAACTSVIEALEQRALLSAVVGPEGTLTVTGSPQADTIDISFQLDFSPGSNAGTIYVFDNGTTTGFSTSVVKKVVVNGDDGNDNIGIDGTEIDNDPAASAINFTVVDGNGQDTVDSIIGETGFPNDNISAPMASLTVGNGNDTVFAQGSTDAVIVAGNGNDTLSAAADAQVMTVSMVAGNGTDQLAGVSSGTASLRIIATVGTGHDTFSNANDPKIFIAANTTNGQSSGAFAKEVNITGLVLSAGSQKPVPDATVYLDANDDGVFDSGDQSITTSPEGGYILILSPLNGGISVPRSPGSTDAGSNSITDNCPENVSS
jgi:hypothetical protein